MVGSVLSDNGESYSLGSSSQHYVDSLTDNAELTSYARKRKVTEELKDLELGSILDSEGP